MPRLSSLSLTPPLHSLFDNNTTSLSAPHLSNLLSWAPGCITSEIDGYKQATLTEHCFDHNKLFTKLRNEWNEVATKYRTFAQLLRLSDFYDWQLVRVVKQRIWRGLLKTLLNEGIINRMVGWILLSLVWEPSQWLDPIQTVIAWLHASSLPPAPRASELYSQQHWFKRCPSLVQWNINRKNEKN